MIHDPYVRVLAAQLRIEHDQADCPVGDAAKNNQQNKASQETGLTNGVWKTWRSMSGRMMTSQRVRSVPMMPAPSIELAMFATESSMPPPASLFAASSSRSIRGSKYGSSGLSMLRLTAEASNNPTNSGIDCSLLLPPVREDRPSCLLD